MTAPLERKTEFWGWAGGAVGLAGIYLTGLLTGSFDHVVLPDVCARAVQVLQKSGSVAAFQTLCYAVMGGASVYAGARTARKWSLDRNGAKDATARANAMRGVPP